MNAKAATGVRRQIAERNLTAILDGAERLLRRGEQPSISAVASEAAVSRPTVYAHFPDRAALIAALVERTVSQTINAIESATPSDGPAAEALERLIRAGWQQLADHADIAQAAASELSATSMRAAHESARDAIRLIIERGRKDGSFRSDAPTGWLVTATLALIHAAGEDVRHRELEPETALNNLSSTISKLLGTRWH